MKREFVLNGSVQTLSKEEFLQAVDERESEQEEITAMLGHSAGPHEEDEMDDDDDNVIANEQQDIRLMLGLNTEKSKPSK